MDIDSTNTLEVLCIGESVTEVETTVYGQTPELIEATALLGTLLTGDNTGAYVALAKVAASLEIDDDK